MHIVLRYHFTDEQVAAFRQLADDMGEHQVTHIPTVRTSRTRQTPK